MAEPLERLAHERSVVPSEGAAYPDDTLAPTATLERGVGGHWGEATERTEDRPPATDTPGSGARAKRGLGGLAALAAVVLKFGAKLKFLIFLIPKVKFLTTSLSMLVSIGAYALLWGLPFAVGLVLLLLVHEMGHVIQLRREGIKATAPMFIPFLGAVVGMKELPPDAAAEARVGLAGPVLGSLGCLVPLAIYLATGSEMFLALAFVGFFLNLFNLMPVLPLDGGRAMAALSPWLWVLGFAMLIGATIAFPNPIMPLILILGGFETFRRFRARRSPESQRYARVPPRTRAAVAAVYAGLAVALAIGMDLTFVARGVGGS
jgi:Zn-dependent protease